jgi:hypothetical protein
MLLNSGGDVRSVRPAIYSVCMAAVQLRQRHSWRRVVGTQLQTDV